jgi:hypothetical protein
MSQHASTRSTAAERQPPSPLWALSPGRRDHFLGKRDRKGDPVWTLEHLDSGAVLQRPFTSLDGTEFARFGLLAELALEPESRSCDACGCRMTPTRGATLTCQTCFETAERTQRMAS